MPSAFSRDVSSCIEGGKLKKEFISQLKFAYVAAFLNSLFSLSGSLPIGGGFLDNFHYNLIYLKTYLFILAALGLSCGIFIAACGLLSYGMRTLSCSMHAGSSSLTRDQTWAPCIGSTESYPLDHQGSPYNLI